MVSRSVHRRDAGPKPSRPLHFRATTLKEVSVFIKKHHYSHTHPAGVTHSFALDFNGALAGAALFGYTAGNPATMIVPSTGVSDHRRFRELMRLVLLDEVPKNAESMFIGWMVRQMRHAGFAGLVSYADTAFGHTGIVYRATNWRFAGERFAHNPIILVDGVEVHQRTMSDRYKLYKLGELKALLGDRIQFVKRTQPKLRFEFPLVASAKKEGL